MFKVKVVKKEGEIETLVEVETESEDLVLAILRHCEVVSIGSINVNQSIDPGFQRLIKNARDYGLPIEPFTVTC